MRTSSLSCPTRPGSPRSSFTPTHIRSSFQPISMLIVQVQGQILDQPFPRPSSMPVRPQTWISGRDSGRGSFLCSSLTSPSLPFPSLALVLLRHPPTPAMPAAKPPLRSRTPSRPTARSVRAAPSRRSALAIKLAIISDILDCTGSVALTARCIGCTAWIYRSKS